MAGPFAISARVPCRDRLSAALLAPGAVVSSAVTAEAPRLHRLSAAPIATVALPAGPHRLRQEGLPHTPANPRTLTHSPAHQHTAHDYTTNTHHLNSHSCLPHRHSRESGNPRPPVPTGRPQGGQRPVRSLPWSLLRGRAGEGATTHPPSASCHPSTALPAALLHRAYGLPPPTPLPRPSGPASFIAAFAAIQPHNRIAQAA